MLVSIYNKRLFLAQNGYELFWFSGKLKDAPRQIVHLLRDAVPGWYIVHLGTSTMYPLADPASYLEGAPRAEWLANEAFYAVLSHHLARMGWVFYGKNGTDVSIFDIRPDARWDSRTLVSALGGDGYYAADINGVSGPFLHEREMYDHAGIKSGLLDGYYSADPKPVGQPYNGFLRPVSVADNVYGLMTDTNHMLATILSNPSMGDALATARMLSLAPDMLQLLGRFSKAADKKELDALIDGALALYNRVFEAA